MGDWFRKRTLPEIRDEMRKGNAPKRCELNYIAEKVENIEKTVVRMEKKIKRQNEVNRAIFVFGFAVSIIAVGLTLYYSTRINVLNRLLSQHDVAEGVVKSTERWMFVAAAVAIFFGFLFLIKTVCILFDVRKRSSEDSGALN